MVTIPGGPMSGSILSLPCRTTGAFFPDPDSRLVRGELENAYGTASVAVRAPGADGVNDTVTVHASVRWSVRPLQPSASTA